MALQIVLSTGRRCGQTCEGLGALGQAEISDFTVSCKGSQHGFEPNIDLIVTCPHTSKPQILREQRRRTIVADPLAMQTLSWFCSPLR